MGSRGAFPSKPGQKSAGPLTLLKDSLKLGQNIFFKGRSTEDSCFFMGHL